MSRIAVIGATGHVGTYLVPRLVRAGHDVVAISRGERAPYHGAPEWRAGARVAVDRSSADFLDRLVALDADAVIDMVCFTAAEAQALVDALRPSPPPLVDCGTSWGPRPRRPRAGGRGRATHGLRRLRRRQGRDRGAAVARDDRRRRAVRDPAP